MGSRVVQFCSVGRSADAMRARTAAVGVGVVLVALQLLRASPGLEHTHPLDQRSHALATTQSAEQRTRCALGCEANGGNCNWQRGKCECPPLRAGEACERTAVPMCAEQWGLSLPLPPCQALVENSADWRDFPPTCE
eukprot:scaffold49897_cov32-Tisochrysis_lutea.AAC.1